ncbi:MAG TPA: hypothetical protein DF383_02605 [Deltaproteobacteria bacterium]|nr:hypothetical protein [Deltaproteobacteria bacterium]
MSKTFRLSIPIFLVFFLLGLFSNPSFAKDAQEAKPEIRPASLKKLSYSVADPDQIAAAPGGLMLLRYIAACALRPDQELTATVEGKKYTFPGKLGLAPEWLGAPLSKSGQRWVSACLMAHVNYFGVHVPISVRAAHPNIQATYEPDELKNYPVREAAFYGNLFAPGEELAYVCRAYKNKEESEYLKLRVCSEETDKPPFTRCEFVSTGVCDAVDPSQYEKICQGGDGEQGYFKQCRGGGKQYEEVITVFVQKK